MWQFILIGVFPLIIGSVMKPLETLDDTAWKSKLAAILSTEDNIAKNQNPSFPNQFLMDDDAEGKIVNLHNLKCLMQQLTEV